MIAVNNLIQILQPEWIIDDGSIGIGQDWVTNLDNVCLCIEAAGSCSLALVLYWDALLASMHFWILGFSLFSSVKSTQKCPPAELPFILTFGYQFV